VATHENPTDVSGRYEKLQRAVGADTILMVLGPLIERRLEALLNQAPHIKPELPELLMWRAELVVLSRMKRELQGLASKGGDVTEVFKAIIGAKTGDSSGSRMDQRQ
jgi:hypothetical protein